MIDSVKMTDVDFEKIKVRTDDLVKFWSMWGYTEVGDMPQYMQDIVHLIAHVEAILKDGDRVQESQIPTVSPEGSTQTSPGSVANTPTGG